MQVSPALLTFKGPHTASASEFISVKNDSDSPLAFKVKTTAPKSYCVRPNAAVLPAGGSLDVLIISQGLEREPTASFKCKDKFLIEGVPVGPDVDTKEVSEHWADLVAMQGGSKNVVSKKIRVAYLIGETYSAEEIDTRKEKAAALSKTPSSKSSPSKPAPAAAASVRSEIDASNAKVAALNDKLDEKSAVESAPPATATTTTTTPASTSSSSLIPLAALVIIIAVLLRYFGYY